MLNPIMGTDGRIVILDEENFYGSVNRPVNSLFGPTSGRTLPYGALKRRMCVPLVAVAGAGRT